MVLTEVVSQCKHASVKIALQSNSSGFILKFIFRDYIQMQEYSCSSGKTLHLRKKMKKQLEVILKYQPKFFKCNVKESGRLVRIGELMVQICFLGQALS